VAKERLSFFPTFPKGFITSEPAETPVYAAWQLPILDDSKAPYSALWSQREALTRYQLSVTKICGTLQGLALGERRELKAIAPWAIIGSLTHQCAKGEPR
jgi:hypothetical protein